MLGHNDLHQPAYVIMMVADALLPNRHQVISNHHADSALTMMSQEPYYTIYYVTAIQ